MSNIIFLGKYSNDLNFARCTILDIEETINSQESRLIAAEENIQGDCVSFANDLKEARSSIKII